MENVSECSWHDGASVHKDWMFLTALDCCSLHHWSSTEWLIGFSRVSCFHRKWLDIDQHHVTCLNFDPCSSMLKIKSDGFQVIGFWECSFHWWQDGEGNPCCMMGHGGIDQQTVTWFLSADHGKAQKRPAIRRQGPGVCVVKFNTDANVSGKLACLISEIRDRDGSPMRPSSPEQCSLGKNRIKTGSRSFLMTSCLREQGWSSW